MTTANEAFLDALLRHQVGLMRVVPGIDRRVSQLLNATEDDLVNQIRVRLAKSRSPFRQDQLFKAIRASRTLVWRDVRQLWVDQLQELATDEVGFLDRTLKTVSPAQLAITLPTVAQVRGIVSSHPFEGATLRQWANKLATDDLARIERGIKIGLVQGESSEQIARRVVGTARQRGANGITQIARNHARAISRTAVNSITNAAKQEFYAANTNLFEKELYVATLDGRTTLICIGYDGKTFKVGTGPIPPVHWQCRSLRVALLTPEAVGERPARAATQRQLLREYTAKERLGRVPKRRADLPHGTRGGFDQFARRRLRELTGSVPARVSYADWLKRQSAEFQDDVLGKTRAKAFRSGKISVDKFTNRQGDVLTIQQLRERDLLN